MKDKKLSYYATHSGLMQISVTYGKEQFDFNLNGELVIDENKINTEAQEQPSAYAFLGMLHKKLVRASKVAEKKMEKKYAQLWLKFKTDKEDGKAPANDTVKAKIHRDEIYSNLWDEFIEAEHQAMVIEVCVRAFEQRANMLQTLSANIRKER
jgi:hypothetical protein